MRNIISIYPFFILISISAQTQKETVTTTSELDTLLHISFNAFAEEAECWTPEQKKEFADVGSWILVGLYDFDKTNSKGDLLEIYTQKDVHDLQKMDGNWHVLGAEKQESVDHVMEKAATTIDLPMDINIDDI